MIEDIVEWSLVIIAIIVFIFLGMLSYNFISNEEKAKECIKNGGEPYYFITSFECRKNINVNLNDK